MYAAGGQQQHTGPLDSVPKALEGIFNTLKLLEPAGTDLALSSTPQPALLPVSSTPALSSTSLTSSIAAPPQPGGSAGIASEKPLLSAPKPSIHQDNVNDKENRYPLSSVSSSKLADGRRTGQRRSQANSAVVSTESVSEFPSKLLQPAMNFTEKTVSVAFPATESHKRHSNPPQPSAGEPVSEPAKKPVLSIASTTNSAPQDESRARELDEKSDEIKTAQPLKRNFQLRRFGISGPPIRSSAMSSLRGPLGTITASRIEEDDSLNDKAESPKQVQPTSVLHDSHLTASSVGSSNSNHSAPLHLQSSAPRSTAPSLSPNSENTRSTIFTHTATEHSHLQCFATRDEPQSIASQSPPARSDSVVDLQNRNDGKRSPSQALQSSPTVKPLSNAASKNETLNRPPPASYMASTTSQSSQLTLHNGGKSTQSIPALLQSSKKTTLFVNGKSYSKLELVGRGGSSKVFRVLSPEGRLFALKRVSLKGLDQSTLQGYLNEIELLRRLQGNERIIELFDADVNQTEGYLHMVMEFGEIDLAGLLQRQKDRKLNLNFIRVYWEQMLQAVHTIHEARVVHSDLKPANFLFVRGQLKLIDFGIAKAIQSDTTNIHRDHQVGTVNYMSPEAIIDTNSCTPSSQLGGEQLMKLGRPSDVWSLGCILYQMIYGKTPFAHLAMIPKIQKIIDSSYAIEFPTTGNSSPLLVDIMRSCLNRDPKRRPTIPQLIDHPFLHPDRLLDRVMNTVPQPLIEKVVHEVLRLQQQQHSSSLTEDVLARRIGEILNGKS